MMRYLNPSLLFRQIVWSYAACPNIAIGPPWHALPFLFYLLPACQTSGSTGCTECNDAHLQIQAALSKIGGVSQGQCASSCQFIDNIDEHQANVRKDDDERWESKEGGRGGKCRKRLSVRKGEGPTLQGQKI